MRFAGYRHVLLIIWFDGPVNGERSVEELSRQDAPASQGLSDPAELIEEIDLQRTLCHRPPVCGQCPPRSSGVHPTNRRQAKPRPVRLL